MTKPECPVFGVCGGCSWQDVSYEEQLERKKNTFTALLGRDDVNVFSGPPYGYRNRMDLSFTGQGIGFREKGKWWSKVDVEWCPISNSRLNELIALVRESFTGADAFDNKKKTGTYMFAVIRTPRLSTSVSFVLNRESPGLEEARRRIEDFAGGAANRGPDTIVITPMEPRRDDSKSEEYTLVKGSPMLRERYLDYELLFPVQGFLQTNSGMAEKMVEYVRELCEESEGHLLDLYGGIGTFGITNAHRFETLTIIESVGEAIEAARRNLVLNKVKNGTALVSDAKRLKEIELPSPLTVITDPPRSGMHPKTIGELGRLRPDKIIYVSCNEKQLVRELELFEGYEARRAALFDLFPQTPRMESIVELARRA